MTAKNKCGLIFLVIVAGCNFAPRASAHGDLHDRIAALSAQLGTNAGNAELWLQRADLQRQHEDFPAALADLEHVQQLKPDWPATALQRARIQFDAKNFSACETAATDCLKLEPGNADARVLRARSLVQLGKPELAVADYDAVLNATNTAAPLPDLYLERARALAVQERWAEAIRGLDAGRQRLGDTPSLALPAMAYERQRGDIAAALARLEQARRFFDAQAYAALRAELLKETGK